MELLNILSRTRLFSISMPTAEFLIASKFASTFELKAKRCTLQFFHAFILITMAQVSNDKIVFAISKVFSGFDKDSWIFKLVLDL